MAYRNGEREQVNFFPPSIEEYVGSDDPVRAYDVFIDLLNLEELGIIYNPSKIGNSEYNPRKMLKLFTYGYSYGWFSGRKLERAVHHNLSFIWLMGGLRPDHKAITEFRRKNKESIRRALRACVRFCIKLDLIEGNVLFTDGTKIRANAGRGKSFTKKHYIKELSKLDKGIDELLEKCERIDETEEAEGSLVKMKKELSDKKRLRARIRDIVGEFTKQGDKTKNGKERTKNLTDTESSLMRSVQGSHSSYNVQSVVDDKHGLIVNVDAVSDPSDVNQFSNQIIQAEEVTGKKCEVACADAGYADTDELSNINQDGRRVIVPSKRQSLHDKSEEPFAKDKFKYNKEENCYYCPAGHKLSYVGKKGAKEYRYRITEGSICQQCIYFGICTKSCNGRQITRLLSEELKENLERQYEQPDSQEIYKRRKCKVEHPFGHIKHNLGMRNFFLRGRAGVQAEISIAAICFNITRMLTIFGGAQKFITKMASVR